MHTTSTIVDLRKCKLLSKLLGKRYALASRHMAHTSQFSSKLSVLGQFFEQGVWSRQFEGVAIDYAQSCAYKTEDTVFGIHDGSQYMVVDTYTSMQPVGLFRGSDAQCQPDWCGAGRRSPSLACRVKPPLTACQNEPSMSRCIKS